VVASSLNEVASFGLQFNVRGVVTSQCFVFWLEVDLELWDRDEVFTAVINGLAISSTWKVHG
jgi:hypothetical protein